MNLSNIVNVGMIADVELKTIASGACVHEHPRYKLTRKDYQSQTKNDEWENKKIAGFFCRSRFWIWHRSPVCFQDKSFPLES